MLASSEGAKKSTIPRSNSVIIDKNLPFSTELYDIHTLFSKYGDIARLLFPPTKTIAIVEFNSATEAKVAFTALAYRKFKEAPLFLEWAPHGLLETSLAKHQTKQPQTQEVNRTTKEPTTKKSDITKTKEKKMEVEKPKEENMKAGQPTEDNVKVEPEKDFFAKPTTNGDDGQVKLLVRNIPFEATQLEVLELFR